MDISSLFQQLGIALGMKTPVGSQRDSSDLELQGYVARRETYRVTPEMNPETGRIFHLHTADRQ